MRKMIIPILAVFIIMAFAAKADAAADTTIEIVLPDTIYVNQEFTAQININNVSGFYGASLDLVYDPEVVQLTGVSDGNIFGQMAGQAYEVINQYDNSTGKLTYCKILTGNSAGINGSGTMINVGFRAVGAGILKLSLTQEPKLELLTSGSNARILLSNNSAQPIFYSGADIERQITVPATGIRLDRSTAVIETNEFVALNAFIEPEGATNRNMVWSSDNPDIAKVDQSGIVTGLSEGITTIRVKARDGGYEASCKVMVDAAILKVRATNPKGNSTDVPVNRSINVMFNKTIIEGRNFNSITLTDASGRAVEVKAEINKNTLIIDPAYDLKYTTAYTVSIPSEAVKSIGGGLLENNYLFSFTTAVQSQPLALVKSSPADNGVNVPVNTEITLEFNRFISFAVNGGRGNKTAEIRIESASGDLIPVAFSIVDNKIIIRLTKELEHNTEYSITVPWTSIFDMDKNRLKDDVIIKFTTSN